jgi:MYXO-CTERM domain-containing protein
MNMSFLKTTLAGLILAGSLATSVAASPIDGTYTAYTLGPNDDNNSGEVSLGFTFNFFGTSYSSLWVNNNGTVSFIGGLDNSFATDIDPNIADPVIAAFWADADTTSNSGVVTYEARANGVNGYPTFGVEWPGVGYYGGDGSKLNSFELLIVSRADLGAGDADIYLNYGSIQWESSDYSGGFNGLGGTCAVAGFSNGAGTSVEVPGSGVCGALIDGGAYQLMTATNDGVAGQYLFQVRNGAGAPGAVPAPGALGLLGLGLIAMVRRRRA